MSRLWDPPKELLRKQNLEAELKIVLNFLHENLDEGWEFYTKPFLDELLPDIILLNENFGIQIIVFEEEEKNPLSRLRLIKSEIFNYYITNQTTKHNGIELIQTCFASPFISKEKVQKKIEEWSVLNEHHDPNFSIITKESLEPENRGAISDVVPTIRYESSQHMNKETADSLRYHIRTSDFILEDLEPLKINMLDEIQQDLILNRTPSGYRRIIGTSGSGKTLVLAARAVDLYKQGKSVLFLCYNKTLVNLFWHYFLRFYKGDEELEVIKKRGKFNFTPPVPIHYMRFAKRAFVEADKELEWKNFFPKEAADDEIEGNTGDMTEELFKILKGRRKNYDAILIDEGQDFRPKWWSAVRQLLVENGEAVYVMDEAQDVYGNVKNLTDNVFKDSGFIGRPTVLKTSYRLPKSYIPFVRGFIEKFLTDESKKLGQVLIPESSPQLELGGLEKCYLSWEQIDEANKEIARQKGIERCTKLVLDILPSLVDSFTYNNITLLCSSRKSGKGIVDNLKKKNILSAHVFNDENRTEDANKMDFFLSKNKVKVSTVHSFKGFESPLVIYFLERGTSFEAAYTALTRLRLSVNNECHLKVVCSDPRFLSYGETWNSPKGEEWLKVE